MNTYNLTFEVRDYWGNVILEDLAHPQPDLSFSVEVRDVEHLEAMMRSYYRTLKSWMTTRLIEVYASVPNTVGGTWMIMHSLRPRNEGLEFLNH